MEMILRSRISWNPRFLPTWTARAWLAFLLSLVSNNNYLGFPSF
jgi:hypothetical protein